VLQAAATVAGACLTTPRFIDALPSRVSVLTVREPYRAFVEVARALFPDSLRPSSLFEASGAAAGAHVHPSARLENGVIVDPGAVIGAGAEIGSSALSADAWHHRADAVSSLAAFIGISIALIGGRGWEAADDWAALVAAILVAVNGVRTLRPAISGLMDEAPDTTVKVRAMEAACSVDGVRKVENLKLRRSGLGFYVDLHVQADPVITLEDAHEIAARVKYAILDAIPNAVNVLVHMEPFRSERVLEEPVLSLPPT